MFARNDESQQPFLDADERKANQIDAKSTKDDIELKEIIIESKSNRQANCSTGHLIRHLEEIQQANSILETKLTPAIQRRNERQCNSGYRIGQGVGIVGMVIALGGGLIAQEVGDQKNSELLIHVGFALAIANTVIQIGNCVIRYCRRRDRLGINLQDAGFISPEEARDLQRLLEANGILGIDISDQNQILRALGRLDSMSNQVNAALEEAPQFSDAFFTAANSIQLLPEISGIIYSYALPDPTVEGKLIRKAFWEATNELKNEEGEHYFSPNAEEIVLDYLGENDGDEQNDSSRRLMFG